MVGKAHIHICAVICGIGIILANTGGSQWDTPTSDGSSPNRYGISKRSYGGRKARQRATG